MLNLSDTQLDVFNSSTARLNFLVGSVRSGKTFVSLVRWLEYVQTAPKGNLVMVGRTAGTIKRNIVDEICNLVGADAKYYIGKGELTLWGRRIYLIGCVDERSEQRLRGSTFAGAYVDEVTLINESFFTMLLSRLSVPGAQLFATTNPDSPFHYIKKNYLDREDLDMKTFEFKLDDNPSLTESFKNNLKKEYTGLWYKRYILGEWCLAEGTIYDFFDERIHTINFAPDSARYYVVGVDYGTTNPTAFGLFGYNPENYPNIWLEDEYYWDSREKMRQKTDTEYAVDLKNFMGQRNIKAVIIDPSAASFKAECVKQGIQNIMDADNDVLNGVRFTSKMLANGTFKVLKKCQHTIKEIQTYVWDEKSIKMGEDKPLKQTDHLMDVCRYALYTYFKPMYEGGKQMDVEQYRRWKMDKGGWS